MTDRLAISKMGLANPCLSHCSVTDRGSSLKKKEAFDWGLAYRLRGLVPHRHGGKQTGIAQEQ